MKLKDNILKRLAKRSITSRPRGKCPDDETLAALAEGKLEESLADELLMHAARCPECLFTLRVIKTVLSEKDKEDRIIIPQRALARAKALDPSRNQTMELVIQFAKGVAKVLKMSDDVRGQAVAATDATRGEGHVVSETLVTFSKLMPPFRTDVDVEKTKPDRGEITVKMTDAESGLPARGVRVSLFDDDLELESSMLDGGTAVFENLKFGQYRVEITRVGEPLGKITLEMKGE